MRVLMIDNYDSFTWNLVHYIGALGASLDVRRNDEITVAQILDDRPDAIVLSPGPCSPDEAGICLDLIAAAGESIPLFGVCLGHQAIGQSYGGRIVRTHPMHGKVSLVSHSNETVFRGINGPFQATRYHSLTIDPATRPAALDVTATSEDGVIMGVSHRSHPVHGVQFHPESIASQHGMLILRNFLDLAAEWNQANQLQDA
ncbi:MAG: aminodeoxychorismate/anthranilate synthase component II [Beijerinckiaceae bacterium]|nr:aminodeoxychorismate/anthranilate synthase component II [Beijerinckiaceae bacterium]